MYDPLIRDIETKWLYLYSIISGIAKPTEFILEPSIKFSFNNVLKPNTNRYSILILNHSVIPSILSKLNITKKNIDKILYMLTHDHNEITNADFIIGIDEHILKIYIDYGHILLSLVINPQNNSISLRKKYVITNTPNDALKYAYLFRALSLEVNINNWRHVYSINDNEFHISLKKPMSWRSYNIYLIGISSNSITIYHRKI